MSGTRVLATEHEKPRRGERHTNGHVDDAQKPQQRRRIVVALVLATIVAALGVLAEVDAALSALLREQKPPHPASPVSCLETLAKGQRAAAHASAFLTRALPLLEPGATDRSAARGLVRYEARGRAALDLEGGCTAAGWRARIEAQRLIGVRAFHLAMSVGLLETSTASQTSASR